MGFDLCWADGQDGYYTASHAVFGALVVEMQAQRMVAADAIPAEELVHNDGQLVSAAQVRAALARAQPEPIRPPDHEVPTVADYVADELSAAWGVDLPNPGREYLLAIPPERWRALWAEWIEFLTGAAEHGGFVVW